MVRPAARFKPATVTKPCLANRQTLRALIRQSPNTPIARLSNQNSKVALSSRGSQ